MAWLTEGDIRDDRDDSEHGVLRGLAWAWLLVLTLAVFAAACWPGNRALGAPPLADHQMCSPALSFPRKVLLYGLTQSQYNQSQLAMARINNHDTRRDWVLQVPLGISPDIVVYQDSSTWVQLSCGAPNSVIIHVGGATNWKAWAEHELIHAVFYMADHIWSSQWPGTNYINPGYCDAPHQTSPYQGIMSYCESYPPVWNAWDDEWEDRIFP